MPAWISSLVGRVRKHVKKDSTWRGSFLDAHDIEPTEDGLFRTSTEEDMLADDGGDIPRPAISEDLLEWLPAPEIVDWAVYDETE